jgi:Flp pilus assembly protein TadG
MKRITVARTRQRGQALVELALVLPILLILFVGIIEFARAWNLHQVITDAAREGARRAVIANNATQAEVDSAVRHYMNQARFDGSKADITFPLGFKTGPGETTAVRIEYDYRFVFLRVFINLVFASTDGTVTLATEARMRNE